MEFQFTPFSLIIGMGALISTSLGILVWQRRPAPGIKSFIALIVGVNIWTIAGAFELAVTTLPAKIITVNIIYLGVVTVNTAWMLFAFSYTGRDHWVTRRTVLLLTIMPALTMIVIWTNHLHQLFWTNRDVMTVQGLIVTDFNFGPLFWVHTAYNYSLVITGTVMLLRAVIRSPQLYRGQIGLLALGGTMPFFSNILFLSALNPLPDYVDLTSTTFIVSGTCIGWAFYRFRLMDIVPVARETIVENMVDGIIVIDSERRIVDINTAALRILGKTGENVVGKSIIDVWTQDLDKLMQFQGIQQANMEVELVVDGKPHTYNVRLSPLKNRRGELTGRVANLSDITALKKINRELEKARHEADEATRLKSEFLATMSHELRTPLNAVIGYSELMLSGMVGELSDKHYQYNERIAKNAKYLLSLINDILDISKIEAGRTELNMGEVNIKEWVDGIVTQNQVLADTKNLEFIVFIDPSLPETVGGDGARLRQIAINLLANAFKFTHEGTVDFKVHKNDKTTWSIIVTDTGVGIPPHKQETIFEEFQQADSSSTREYGGTGLGLAIVRQFVLMMGGHIRLHSEIDKGSTFTVILPLINSTSQEAKLQAGQAQ